jgi:hypothetical protein
VTSNGFARLRPRAPPAGHSMSLRPSSRMLPHSLPWSRHFVLSYSPFFGISDSPPFAGGTMSEHEPIFPEGTAGGSSPREITFTPRSRQPAPCGLERSTQPVRGTGGHCSERQIAFMASGEYLANPRTRLDLPRAYARAPVEGTTLTTSNFAKRC